MCRELHGPSDGVSITVHSKRKLLFLALLAMFFLPAWVQAQTLTVSFNKTDPACAGLPMGTVTAVPSGGTGPYSYFWNTGATTATLTGLRANTYSVTVTDAGSNTATGSVTLTDPTPVEVTFTTSNNCSTPVTITADASGGTGPYTYKWETGPTGPTITVTEAGKYCVTVTDASLCGRLAYVTVNPNPPSVEIEVTDVLCAGDENGSVTATGGTPPFTYAWSNGGTTATISGLAAGTYTVTVTDAGGCTATASGTVAEPSQLNVNISSTGLTCAGSSDGRITANVTGGTAPYTYLWENGATGSTRLNLGPGTYRVTVTDANNCSISRSVTLSYQSNLGITVDKVDPVCEDDLGQVSVVAMNGVSPYSYRWEDSGGNFIGTTATVTDLFPDQFFVTVTDNLGCQAFGNVTVDPGPEINISIDIDAPTCGNADGVAEVTLSKTGNGPPYMFTWTRLDSNKVLQMVTTNTPTDVLNGVEDGVRYGIDVKDAEGCSEALVFQPICTMPVVAEFIAPEGVCEGTTTGSIITNIVQGEGPFTYKWSTGATTPNLSNLAPGTYTVTIESANDRASVNEVVIESFDNPEVEIIATEVVCGGEDVGTAEARVTGGQGPFSYMWSNGMTGKSLDNMGSGTYLVTVTDANGCVGTAAEDIMVVEDLILEVVTRPLLCNGDQSGGASVSVEGGIPPYRYLWSNGDTTSQISGVAAGTYNVVVTDSAGCTATAIALIDEPDALVVNIGGTSKVCAGDGNGVAQAIVDGGTGPYRYNWSNGGITETITGLDPGTYTITVTDLNGCNAMAGIVIESVPNVSVAIDATTPVCGGLDTASAEAIVTGGTGPFNFVWNTQATTQKITGLGTGNYSVVVSDANNCTDNASVQITVLDAIEIEISSTDPNCAGESTGTAMAEATGGMGPYTYQWSNGTSGPELTGLSAGTYTVTVTDAASCTGTASVTLTDPDALVLQFEARDERCGLEGTGLIRALVSGGTGPYTYLWNTSATTDSVNADAGVTYSVTVTDSKSCQIESSASVGSQEAPSCTIQVTRPLTNPTTSDGEATVSATGGVPPYSFAWSNGATGPTATGLSAQLYTVTVTDANGCTSTCQIGIGDLTNNALVGDVWRDTNRNGIQDPGETGVPGIPLVITKVGEDEDPDPDTTYTHGNGFYQFVVTPGIYKITILLPDSLRLTTPDQGSDNTKDSDFDPRTLMTEIFQIDMGEVDLTWDAGLVGPPGSRLGTACNCLNNATNQTNGQFEDRLEVVSVPGDVWLVISQTGAYQTTSDEPPAAPTNLPIGTILNVNGTDPSVYELDFRHITDLGYSITLTNGFDTLTLANTCSYPKITLDGIPDGDIVLCTTDAPLNINVATTVPGEVEVLLDGVPTRIIDPAVLGVGEYELIVTLSPNDPEECESILVRKVRIETQGCKAKLGDFIWLDEDEDGVQDPGEPGLGGVKVILQRQGFNGFSEVATTTSDNNGMYMFLVDPGTYKLTFEASIGYGPTTPNSIANDSLDSDADPTTLMTDVYTLTEGEINPTIDAGFVRVCINLTDPGEIAGDQMLCGPGADPDPIISVREASGGEGELEYMWMKSTRSAVFNSGYYIPIDNSNSPSYDPGPVYEDTYFVRCARRVGCPDWIEPDPVVIKVGDQAKAEITGPSTYCVDEGMGMLMVETKTANPQITWELPGAWDSDDIHSHTLNFTFSTWGLFDVRVHVTENGCTVTGWARIWISPNPTYCAGSDLVLTARIKDGQSVELDWRIINDRLPYNFYVERSADSSFFSRIAELQEPTSTNAGFHLYRFTDATPRIGRNFYRVEIENEQGVTAYSNTVDVMLYFGKNAFMAYPNPTSDMLTVEMLKDPASDFRAELVNVNGMVVKRWNFQEKAFMQYLDLSDVPEGMYFIRLSMGDETTEVIKIIKQRN